MQLVLTVLGVFTLMIVVAFAMTLRNLVGIRIKKPTIELRPDNELPGYLENFFKPIALQLHSLGFDRLQCLYRDSFISHEMSGKWSILFGHRGESAYAEVALTTIPAEMPGYELSFATMFSDDLVLQTVNCRKHGIFVDIPKVIFIDPCVPDITKQWQTHCEKSRELQQENKPLPISPLHYVNRQQLAGEQMIEEAFAQGLVKNTGNGEWAFKFNRAVPLACRLIKGQQRSARLQKARNKMAAFSREAVPVEAEVESFLHIESINKKKPIGRLGKTLILLISVMLFCISFGITLSLQSVLFLLGTLMFHELGHFMGMYLCGYKNLQVLFVPFLGAVAYGSEENTHPIDRVIVLLLGPLPGIILGVAGFCINARFPAQWLSDLSTMLLTLNFFNLLPVMPLDGGQLLQTVLFQRFPRIQTMFYVMSTLFLGLGALLANDAVLRTLAIIMCLAVPAQWRTGSALVRMKKGLTAHIKDERQRLAHFFSVLREKRFAAISFVKKVVIVKTAERELKIAPAPWSVVAVTLVTYGVAVILPISIFFSDIPIRAKSAAAAVDTSPIPVDWDVKIARAATNDERFALLLQAGTWFTEIEDEVSAKRYFAQACEVARSFGENDVRVAKSNISLASLEDAAQARPLLEQALHIQEQQLGPRHPEIAETLQLLADTGPGGAAIPLLERRVAILEDAKGANNFKVKSSILRLVSLYEQERNDQLAEKSIQRCLYLIRKPPAVAEDSILYRELAIYYAAHSRYDEAAQLLHEGMTRIRAEENYSRGVLKAELAWIYLLQGKGEEATRSVRETLDAKRVAQKESQSYKKLGALNYLLLNIFVHTKQRQYFDKSGASLGDVPLLLDLSALYLASGRTEEAKKAFEEAELLENKYGRKGRTSLLNVRQTEDLRELVTMDFQQSWAKRKEQWRNEVRAKFQRG